MIKIIISLLFIILNTSCSTFHTNNKTNSSLSPATIKDQSSLQGEQKNIGKYDIDLTQELTYNSEVTQINQLNKMSMDANNKTTQQQLMDALFANKNRSPRDINSSYLRIVRDKKRFIRKKLSDKRKLFFSDQKEQRKEHRGQLKLRKDLFKKDKPSADEKKEYYKNHSTDRRHFHSEQRFEKKQFESNHKALEKEVDARFKDLDREFKNNLKVYKSTYKK